MSDRFALPLLALLALGLVALALVWPQGLGRRSPGLFGHPVAAPAPSPAPVAPAPAAKSQSPATTAAPAPAGALRGELPAADAKR
jgi:hypothetical protein